MRYRTTNYERWRAAADTFAIAMSEPRGRDLGLSRSIAHGSIYSQAGVWRASEQRWTSVHATTARCAPSSRRDAAEHLGLTSPRGRGLLLGVRGELGEQIRQALGLVGQWLHGHVSGVEELKAIGGDLHRPHPPIPRNGLGHLFHCPVSVHRVGNVPGDRCSAIELSCEMAGAVVRTDTDKNTALCSATSTSPMTCSTMKLSRIISRAERVR